MRDPLAKISPSGASPGERLENLAKFLRKLRSKGYYVFSADHCKDEIVLEQLHNDHVAEIRRLADLEERFTNG